MNDLELAFNEPSSSRGRHRRGMPRREPEPPKRRGRRGRTVAALTIVLLLLGGLVGGGWYGLTRLQEAFGEPPDYTTGGSGSVTVVVEPGDTGTVIAGTLFEADVVKSVEAFVAACAANPDCAGIQPGTYDLRKRMRASAAVALLLDPASRVVQGVTIPEGLSIFRTFELLSEQLDIPVEEFERAAEDPLALGVPEWWFTRQDGQAAAESSVEGFLFPDTYEFPPDATATSVLETMVDRFLTVTGDLSFADRVEQERDISPYEALIVASLAQAEAGVPEDLGRIARVAYNRVYRVNMALQFDVTANYWLEVQGEDPRHSGELTNAELDDPDNPYNTGLSSPGLPLGPINSPGKAALEGAMDPADGDWLYFVAINLEGKSAFAETLAEHEANIQRACANGVPLC